MLRTYTFVATGLSSFAPLVHGIKLFGLSQMLKQSGMPYYLTEGVLYILRAIVYAVSITARSPLQIFACISDKLLKKGK